MGSFCSPSPATSNTNQQQSYQANPAITSAGTQALGMATSAANAPFQMPAAPVAGFNPFQTQAFNQTQAIQGGTNPYFQNASNEQTIGQQPVSQSDIAANMNPFAQGALSDLQKYVFDPQRTQTMGNAVQTAGGVGADRLALTQQNLAKTQSDALTQAESGFYGQAYSQAAAAKQQALQSAQGWANLGAGQQGAQLQATGALAGAGAQQQALSQAQLNSPYQQQLAQIAYPFQTAQFLAGITGGLAPAFGGTTSGQSNTSSLPSQPSLLNQILGGGMSAAGLAGGLGAFGGSGSGSSPTLYGGGVDSGGNNGQPVFAYADGGGVENDPGPYSGIIPQIKLPMGGGENTGGHLNLSPPPAPSSGQSGGSGGGMDIGKIASMAMMFMADGGTVDPQNAGMGYANGGDTQNPYSNFIPDSNFIPAQNEARPSFGEMLTGAGKFYGDLANKYLPSPPTGSTQSPWAKGILPDVGSMIRGPTSAGQAVPQPQAPQPFNYPMPANSGWPNAPMQLPNANQPAPSQQVPQAGAFSPAPSGGSGLPRASSNPDMNVSDWNMPKDQTPYPDALSRDSGQNLARSPWLALLNAGAKTMQSTKGGIGGLGEGIEAGTKTLEDQRKELRSEEAVNQKAEELYRHAKSELLKYTRKTPHELATEHLAQERLNQERYTWQSGTGVDPTTGQPTYGAYRLPTKQGESPQFFPGAGISGRSGAQSTALMRNIQGLVEAGIAPDKQAAFGLLHQSVNSPAVYRRLVQAQEKILQGDPDWIGKNSEDRRNEAERIVKQGQDAAAQAGNSQTSGVQPGATASSALPDPGDGNRVSGMWYINPGTGKPDRWR